MSFNRNKRSYNSEAKDEALSYERLEENGNINLHSVISGSWFFDLHSAYLRSMKVLCECQVRLG